jgi:thymidylate synthase ThyX
MSPLAPFRLRSAPPAVRLVNAHARPLDNAVAAARTCYSGKGIVYAEEVGGDGLAEEEERARARDARDQLAKDIFAAGHHTVYQHAHFQFSIDRVSRHALWAFFHAHPFYNSEQVSQRYVKVGRGATLVPELGDPAAQELFEQTLALQEAAYHRLSVSLEPIAARLFFGLFPARSRAPEKWAREIRRKAQEAARYVLPVATWARLHHSISAITLLRYRRACAQYDVPGEVRLVVDAMLDAVLALDPDFRVVVENPIPLDETPEARALAAAGGLIDPARAAAFRDEFDATLDGRVSRLIGYSPEAEVVVAQAVREVLGLPRATMADDAALALAADPAANAIYGEALNLTTLGKLTRTLHHASYTFRRKLSHTADSQDQRHRMTPASRPVLLAHLTDGPDVVLPRIADEDPDVRRDFDETFARTWEAIGRLRARGVDPEALVYLLPNAVAVRFTESGDLSAIRHKHAMRLCYNAQEEIWRASLDEALQIRAVHPRLGQYLQPPCSIRLRGGKKPYCPEGKRYCGVPVWKQELKDYARVL